MFSLPQTAVRYVHETVARDAARRRRERELHDLQRAQLLPLLASGEQQRDAQTMQSAALAQAVPLWPVSFARLHAPKLAWHAQSSYCRQGLR